MAKKYLDNLKVSVLSILVRYAKWNFIKINEIRDRVKEEEDFVWDSRIRDELADNYGILCHITSSINQLRNEGHPILSSSIQGKGYTYAGDWRRDDLDKIWDDKFNANERRKNIPKSEKEKDNELFNQLMERVTKAVFNEQCKSEVREKLLVVARKYKLKKRGENAKK